MRQAAYYLAPFRKGRHTNSSGGGLSAQPLFTYEVNSVERGDPEAGCSIGPISRHKSRGNRAWPTELNKVTRKGIIELGNQP